MGVSMARKSMAARLRSLAERAHHDPAAVAAGLLILAAECERRQREAGKRSGEARAIAATSTMASALRNAQAVRRARPGASQAEVARALIATAPTTLPSAQAVVRWVRRWERDGSLKIAVHERR